METQSSQSQKSKPHSNSQSHQCAQTHRSHKQSRFCPNTQNETQNPPPLTETVLTASKDKYLVVEYLQYATLPTFQL